MRQIISYFFKPNSIKMKIFAKLGIDRLYFKPDRGASVIETPELVIREGRKEHRAIYYRGIQGPGKKAALLIAHGNAGNIYQRRYLLDSLYTFFSGDIYCFEYPGFGRLKGQATIQGCIDEFSWWYYKLLDAGYSKIDLYGESIGAAIIMKGLVSIIDRSPIERIYLESAFSSIKQTVRDLNPFLYWLYKFVRLDHLNTAEILELFDFGDIQLIFIHSPDDKMINISHAYHNFEIANTKNKQLYLVAGGHNNIQLAGNIFK